MGRTAVEILTVQIEGRPSPAGAVVRAGSRRPRVERSARDPPRAAARSSRQLSSDFFDPLRLALVTDQVAALSRPAVP
jgi:hypothetical protein